MSNTDMPRLLRLKQIIGDPKANPPIGNHSDIKVIMVGGCKDRPLSESYQAWR